MWILSQFPWSQHFLDWNKAGEKLCLDMQWQFKHQIIANFYIHCIAC